MRHEGEEQCGMHINCCNANGPRAFTLLPKMALMTARNEIFVNLYCQSLASVWLNTKNKVNIIQTTGYPVSNQIEITLESEKPEVFTLALRIPSWSNQSSVTVNGIQVEGIRSGCYYKINREWKKDDKIILTLDLRGRLITLNGCQAIMRGPILLARDSRFNDGFVDEAAVVQNKNKDIDLLPSANKPEHIWMAFTAPLVLGTDLEGEFRQPRQVHFCDFSSAGNTWSYNSRYRVWIRQTINAMNGEYKTY
jgi:hypothetical protein